MHVSFKSEVDLPKFGLRFGNGELHNSLKFELDADNEARGDKNGDSLGDLEDGMFRNTDRVFNNDALGELASCEPLRDEGLKDAGTAGTGGIGSVGGND